MMTLKKKTTTYEGKKIFFQQSAFNDISQILQQMVLQWFPNLHKRMKVITAAVTLKHFVLSHRKFYI
jgi:hypothetical protein